ncbi:MAG: CPBP family intramembrane metalloprotease [Myxococcota bacterium]|nr:CPBP family intramembrane metalloprotease [Myxococcota bacterium]
MLARIAWPVWNAEERRLRALVRIALYAGMITVAMLAVGLASMFVDRSLAALAALFALQMALVVGVSFAAARWIDRRPVAELGLAPRRGYVVDLAFGVALGGICMGAIAGFESALGWGRYAPRFTEIDSVVAALPASGSALTIFVAVAVIEELTFRGYPLLNLSEGMPAFGARRDVAITVAVVLTSIAFGVAHAGNPGSSPTAVAFVAFGGMFLAVGLVLQGDLAIPIGAHFGWNFFQNVLGMQVSGQTQFDPAAWLRRDELGPDVATGGTFGPEAGLEGLAAMVLGIVLTFAWVRLRAGKLQVHERFLVTSRPRGVSRARRTGREVDGVAGA